VKKFIEYIALAQQNPADVPIQHSFAFGAARRVAELPLRFDSTALAVAVVGKDHT